MIGLLEGTHNRRQKTHYMMESSNDRQHEPEVLPSVRREHAKGRSLVLLVALITSLLVAPYLGDEHSDTVSPLVNLLGSIVPLAGIYAMTKRRRTWLIAAALSIPVLMGAWIPETGEFWLLVARRSAGIVFYVYITVAVLIHTLRGSTVSDDKLYAALSVYFLFAITFGIAYILLEQLSPGSFSYGGAEPGRMQWHSGIYLSFAALTTLGFGDIVPVSAKARSLVGMEAALGVLYVAVLVARLVGTLGKPTEMGSDAKR